MQVLPNLQQKICNKCKILKDVRDFYVYSYNKNIPRPMCISCDLAEKKKRYELLHKVYK